MKFDKNTINLSGMVYGDQNPLDLGLRVLTLSGELVSPCMETIKAILTKEQTTAFRRYLEGEDVSLPSSLQEVFHTWYRNNLDDVRLFASFWCLDSQGFDFCYHRTQIH